MLVLVEYILCQQQNARVPVMPAFSDNFTTTSFISCMRSSIINKLTFVGSSDVISGRPSMKLGLNIMDSASTAEIRHSATISIEELIYMNMAAACFINLMTNDVIPEPEGPPTIHVN